jgi:HAD superfamily hydrolase (TIGR01490 family)
MTVSSSPTALALFDLDHTLIPLDSDVAWSQYLIAQGLADPVEHARRNDAYYAQYVAGTLDPHEYLNFSCEPLLKLPMEQVKALRADYFATRIQPNIQPQALALVRQHLQAGDLCAVVMATNSFITRPIADAFGITHLIGTDLEIINDRITGRALGQPSFREGKITRTRSWLAEQGLSLEAFAHSWFYGDSVNDIPILKTVKHPVATNPDARLLKEAQSHHWLVLNLFTKATA